MKKNKHLSEKHKMKISEAHKGMHHSEDAKTKMRNKYVSDETKRKISEANKGRITWMKGKSHSEESKRKVSIASKGHKTSDKTKQKISNSLKGKIVSEETKKKISEMCKGEKSSQWKGGKVKTICKICKKQKYVYPSKVKEGNGKFCSLRCSAIYRNIHMKKYDTNIEQLIEEELKNQNILYMKQVPIEGIALVDFLLPNRIIIQADGNYWHSRKINKGRDTAQDTVLYFKGYRVFRFTETEIKKSAQKCINKVIQNINE